MTASLIIGIGGMITLMVIWIIVQSGWREVFAEDLTDEDVLAAEIAAPTADVPLFVKKSSIQENKIY